MVKMRFDCLALPFINLGRLHYLCVRGGRHSRVDVKILTLSLLFGFLRSPCVHFIHQNLNSVEKIFFFAPPKRRRQFFLPP